MQKQSALSTSEAELYALVSCSLVSCVQDMIYVKQLLESMGLTVKTPIIVKVDKKGSKAIRYPRSTRRRGTES